MAILARLVLGACALASVAQAFPRIKMVTVTDVVTVTDYEVVNSTTTIWRPINESPTATPTLASVESVAPAVSPSSAPAVQPSAAPVTVSPAVQTTTSPAIQQAAVATTTPVAAVVTPQPAPSTFVTSTTPAAAAAPAPSPSAAPSVAAGSFASASATNTCEGTGDACEGDVTHWDGGLGACGWDVNTASDMQVALPVGFMGTLSNSNPYCGRSITLYNPASGTTVQAKVGDKCMGCEARAIDCTDALFNAITDGTGDGRVSGIEWWLN